MARNAGLIRPKISEFRNYLLTSKCPLFDEQSAMLLTAVWRKPRRAGLAALKKTYSCGSAVSVLYLSGLRQAVDVSGNFMTKNKTIGKILLVTTLLGCQ